MKKENIKKKFHIEPNIENELAEINKILRSNEPDDLKFRSIRAIFNELSEEIVDAKINAMFESRTGLLSAAFGEEALAREIEQSKRTGEKFTVALIDIDFLKYINDNFGHVVGTKVIIEVAQSLKEMVRKYDILCRYGGDEFLAIFPNTTLTKAQKVIKRIKTDIESKKFERDTRVTVSIGMIECCDSGRATTKKLISAADKELYTAKKNRINVNLK